MGGSSSSKSSSQSSAAAAPATPTPQPGNTVSPFMPGMDIALAQQLAAGYGGNPQDFMAAFAQTYAPMQVPSNPTYTPPATPAKPATSVPSVGATRPGSAWSGGGQR